MKTRFSDFETQAAMRLKYELGLEEELEAYKKKYDELAVEFQFKKIEYDELAAEFLEKKLEYDVIEGKLRDLNCDRISVESQLKEISMICSQLREQNKCLEGEKKIIGERVKNDQERFTCLKEEKEKMECDLKDKCVQLNNEIKGLKDGKKMAEFDIEVLNTKLTESENQAAMRLKHGIQLGMDLELYKIKCHGLSTELMEKEMECAEFEGQLNKLILVKVALDEELEEYRTACSRMQQKVTGLAEAQKVISNREKRAQERTAHLEEVIKKIENDEREIFVRLKTENRDLECWKRRAEDEIGSWKKRCTELETHVSRVEEENSTLRSLQNAVSCDDIVKKYRNDCTCRMDFGNVSHLNWKDKVLSKTGCSPSSNNRENFIDLHVP
ncbi:hypothetical protein MKW94_030375, partial [Papaver nudicaule]|nr:hypothetical protein [Papaver nudicaule]